MPGRMSTGCASEHMPAHFPSQPGPARGVAHAAYVIGAMAVEISIAATRLRPPPVADFGALYHRRWRVEEAFKRIKHRLRLEAPTGLTHLAFQHDFAARILADNLHTLLTSTAPDPGEQTPARRPNRTCAIGTLKPILAGCLLQLTPCLRALPAALAAIAQARCRVQPNRLYPRPPRPKPHLHLAYKLAC